nr:phosphate-starvation-inducible PsiE family protein [Pseudomonas sp. PS02290]
MSAYERFEQLVVIALSLIIAVVILIALLALSRKFVILDTLTTPASTIAALGFATLVLGVVCWLLGKRDLSAQD